MASADNSSPTERLHAESAELREQVVVADEGPRSFVEVEIQRLLPRLAM